MKQLIKKITALFLVLSAVLSFNVTTYAGLADWQLPEDISPLQQELPKVSLFADFYFLDKKIEYKNRPYLATGRIYVDLAETVTAMGGTVSEEENGYKLELKTGSFFIEKTNDDKFPKRILEVDGKIYVSLIKLLAGSGYEPVFNTRANRIDIYYSQRNIAFNNLKEGVKKSAYLRIEDVMADGLEKDGCYTDETLEKLRTMADYLFKNNQRFYIAWIPLYRNGSNNLTNNLTTDFNLYNASYLYTMDYLVYRGGKMGLHGLTHQYNSEKSADGYEFGANTPFSDIECVERMLEAKKIARDLGFEVSFFEFPHYSATADQLRYAEKYFNVIYQQDSTVLTKGYIVSWNRANGSFVKYVPTPADYIYNKGDIDGIYKRIDSCIAKQQCVSLFYHPRLDFDLMELKTENNVRICSLKEDSFLYRIVEKVAQEGYSYDYF